jgi:hypothetical protein
MSCVSSWRLYPRRSIASHSICGSGRLFTGLLEKETRRARSIFMGAKETSDPELAQECKRPDRLSRNFFGWIFRAGCFPDFGPLHQAVDKAVVNAAAQSTK